MIVAEMINTHDLVLTKKTIPGGEYLGERTGSIRSQNYKAGVSGFKINYNGDVEFNNGAFRGHIEAVSGVFHGRIEAEEGIFKGSIISGPLTLVDETPISSTITYAAGTEAYDVVNTELNRKGISVNPNGGVQAWTFNISGTYAENNIIAIRFYVGMPAGERRVRVTYQNGTQEDIAGYWGANDVWFTSLSSQLSFVYTSGGKTFKLISLPTQDPHIPGVVWRNGNQLMISV